MNNPLVLIALITAVTGIITTFLTSYFSLIQNRKNSVVIDNIREKADILDTKADSNHQALNSQLDKFKKESAENYEKLLRQGIIIVQAESDKKLSEMAVKIIHLEKLLSESLGKELLAKAETESSANLIKKAAEEAVLLLQKATEVAKSTLNEAAKEKLIVGA